MRDFTELEAKLERCIKYTESQQIPVKQNGDYMFLRGLPHHSVCIIGAVRFAESIFFHTPSQVEADVARVLSLTTAEVRALEAGFCGWDVSNPERDYDFGLWEFGRVLGQRQGKNPEAWPTTSDPFAG